MSLTLWHFAQSRSSSVSNAPQQRRSSFVTVSVSDRSCASLIDQMLVSGLEWEEGRGALRRVRVSQGVGGRDRHL